MKTPIKKTQKTAAAKAPEEVKAEPVVEKNKKNERYFSGIGRRKTAIAQVRLYPQKRSEEQAIEPTANGKNYKVYFPTIKQHVIINSPVELLHLQNRFKITAITVGGGKEAQAVAMRLGIARALIKANPIFKKPLKRAGYLTRDARKKERKKPGLKKARRAPQWQKR